jgi:PAS domain S-box-containing protein
VEGSSAPGTRLAFAFAITLAVLIAAAILVYASVERLADTNRAVAHSQEVRGELTRTLSTLQDAETSQRGFLLTGDPHYLGPYRTARRVLPERLARLDALTQGRPDQQRLVADLRASSSAKLAELRDAIQLRRHAGFEAARQMVMTGRGRDEMERIRDTLADLGEKEHAALTRRTRQAAAASREARFSFGLITFVALGGVGLVYELAQRQLRSAQALKDERGRAAESQARLAAIVESSSDAIVGKTLDGIVTSWNRGAERLFGYTAAEMIGQSFARIIPPDRSDDLRTILAAVRRGERVDHYETERLRKDGRRITIDITASATSDASGRIVGASTIAHDITERKEVEERVRALSEFNQTIITNMGEGLYTVDSNGHLTSINPAAERMLGWTAAEIRGRRMHDVIHYVRPDGSPFPAEECPGLAVLKGGTLLREHEDVFVRRDGTLLPVVYSSGPIRADGELTGVVVVFRDVTHKRQADAERERLLADAECARTRAEAANQAKDAFLATISHELRTPLSPILAWSRMLRQGLLDDEKTSRAFATIERCAKAQAQLVEDLLDVSRIVSGKLRLDVRPVDLAPLVSAAVDVMRPAAEARAIRLHAVLDPWTGRVSGDPERLQQVVWNLISNAVKFTPRGGRVQVVLERVHSHVEIAVSDTGQGIPPEFVPHVFERFQQADLTMSRAHGGLGLGLAIVRHIVELHGGTVHADSPGTGQGAVFTVKLPLIVLARTADEVDRRHPREGDGGRSLPASPSLHGVRILVVDDDPDSNEVVRTILAARGAEVEVAASAAQAVQAVSAFHPDVLVSDIGMPGQDGFALIRQIRGSHEDLSRRLPAVALTAYTSVDDRVRLFSAGFQAHVTKPLDPAELIAVVASAIRDPGGA